MNSGQTQTLKQLDSYIDKSYKYGFVTDLESDRPAKGLNEDTIKFISKKKFVDSNRIKLDEKLLKNYYQQFF